MNWLYYQWDRFLDWLASFTPCYKEELGYNCRHRTYADGSKECGQSPENYWRGDSE